MNNFIYILKYPNGDIKQVGKDDVFDELYYQLAVIPDIKDSIILQNNFDIKDVKTYLKELPKEISKIDNYIPLFDINSKNIYIINPENLYFRVIEMNYRLPDKNTIKYLTNAINYYTKKNNHTVVMLKYIETLTKNINFLKCFDFKILRNTFHTIFFENTPITKDMTNCIRPSYVSFLNKNKPYFLKSELKMLALNMGLKLETENLEYICNIIKENDIDANTLIMHQIYINGNNVKEYIELYTLLGSFYINNYLRFPSTRDLFLENKIEKLWYLMKLAPAFDKSYYVYRFVETDEFLRHLKVGDIHEEKSFVSTTRNPFYDPKNNIFGFVLLKIKLPSDKHGIGLCLESYSLFSEEQEIILSPGKLKLTGVNDDFSFYHPNPIAQNKIKKKYEFEYISPIIDDSIFKYTKDYIQPSIEIPLIDFSKLHISGSDYNKKIKAFIDKIPSINYIKYFYSTIGNKKYKFQIYNLESNIIYNKYFFLQNKYDKDNVYIVLEDEITSNIKLLIELKDIISVNYIFKYIGSTKYFDDEDILTFISNISLCFGINKIIYHGDYISYEKIAEDQLEELDISIIDFNNPDTHTMNLFSGYFRYYPDEIINYLECLQTNEEHKPVFNGQPGILYLMPYTFISMIMDYSPEVFLKVRERSPLYRIYEKNKDTFIRMLDFYLYIHQYYFYLIDDINNRIAIYLQDSGFENNPWLNNYIIFNPYEYLFEKGYISNIEYYDDDNGLEDYILRFSNENLGRKPRHR